ncbi:serine/threonine protein kinase [Neobacillus bataviensis]|uniref:serine/threonine protein kinase n=1 Tax=Neobacillus bataviensis TaxID=220685 RepID=UPI001CBF4FD2|nr:protein kinase [Neobacillus bataviensis]
MVKKIILLFSNLFERPFSKEKILAGRYQVISHLGMGSYGHSYLVVDLVTQTKKVLKALRLHKRITKAGRQGFELEKVLLNSMDNPGFPMYFEDGTFKKIPYYTMEFIDGKNFEQLIFAENMVIPEREAFRIAFELLEHIEYLHSRNLIHRDIRIPNVIQAGSKIRLIDLGLARPLNFKYKEKRRKLDLRKEVNQQADFYGLGHFLLFLLYSNFTVQENTAEKSWEVELDISDQAKRIIRRLLQIDIAYDNCAQIKADIQQFILNQGREKNVVL